MLQLIKIFNFTLLLSALVSCSSIQKNETSIGLNLVSIKISENTFVVRDTSFYNTNVLVAKMPDETVLIASSMYDTVTTNKMITWIKRKLSPKKIIAINTHFHADGTGGNEAYHNNGIEIWSSNQTKDLYSKRADSMRSSLAKFVKDERLSKNILKRKNLPAHKFFDSKQDLKWKFGDEEVIISYPGPAHTKDNIVVFLPKQKILFGGCLLRALNWKSLGNTNDADLNNYYNSTEKLLAFNPEVVIPGHGAIGNKTLIIHTMNLAKRATPKDRL